MLEVERVCQFKVFLLQPFVVLDELVDFNFQLLVGPVGAVVLFLPEDVEAGAFEREAVVKNSEESALVFCKALDCGVLLDGGCELVPLLQGRLVASHHLAEKLNYVDKAVKAAESVGVVHVLADYYFREAAQLAFKGGEVLAELGLPFLADSREVEGRNLRVFLLELSQKLLDVLADVLEFLPRILQLLHEMRLLPGEVGDPLVEAHEHVDHPEESFF